MLKFAICDDESWMRKELLDGLAEYMKEKRLGSYRADCFPDGRSLLESDCDFDLIFLDIQMEKPDGMETARLLRQRGKRGLLVFVTVLKESVFEAFEVQAHDYLVKPPDPEAFARAMDRALRLLARRADKSILIRKGSLCGAWTDVFSAATGVIWSISIISGGAKTGGCACLRVRRFPFPGCGKQI